MKNQILKLSTLFCLSLTNLFSNIGPEGFHAFKNHYFIETGTFGGNAIQLALIAGFKEIRSIELDSWLHRRAQIRFRNHSNVKLFSGSSAERLSTMIKDIDKPATFWLDAHQYPPHEDGCPNCPLIEELDQIKAHPIKTHTILIDDMHCAGTLSFDLLTKEDLKTKIWEINPDYEITYVDGGDLGEVPNNVMVARLPKES